MQGEGKGSAFHLYFTIPFTTNDQVLMVIVFFITGRKRQMAKSARFTYKGILGSICKLSVIGNRYR